MDQGIRRIVLIVALANLAYFSIEFVVALRIGSASLFADSADFFEDASVNLLIFVAMAWSARNRARAGMAMAVILLLPAVAFLWTAWNKFEVPIPPEPFALGLTGLGALVVNVSCAYLLAAYRNAGGSLTKAAFLSARNDAFANVAIIAAGAVTFYLWRSPWPDLIVGFGIAWMNLDAAKEVWVAAHEEHRAVA
ncbi:cation transporter [Rhizobium sp. LjRoot98]|uniref:cation transporter n=1 Tax=unclassified Rhizobium TaxID=2613769 RepID=UPI0007149A6F|nr:MULTISPECIES: cation transporter [unclassified Rhizobium]KQV29920.1 cobalt transporter [Rhizobium sp. Root1204]KQY04945.1 cobalt transporter [Rhizobium sp. Root1334]KRC01588.1 cobalt transporter [Rhizobium sp. Root73]